jgi:deoxyribodipyrimidine photo-lyase
VWFRSDLRVRDHPALHAACSAATAGVTACFLIAHEQWREHVWSPWKADLLLRALRDLGAALHERGIPLLIRTAEHFQEAPAAILGLVRQHGCDAVFCNDEHEVNEVRRDGRVQAACEREGIAFRSFLDQVLLDPAVLRTGTGTPYTVFTPFANAAVRSLQERGLPRLHGEPPEVRPSKLRPDPVPERLTGFAPPPRGTKPAAGEAAALARLREFLARSVDAYPERRDLPGIDGTSLLSPHLALGTVAVRRCLEEARLRNGGLVATAGSGAAAWMRQLLWREFYRHVVVHFPRVCMGRPFQLATEAVPWRDDAAALAAWCEGRTGFPIVDAAMRCLVATGNLHNRLRMVVAQFLTKHLLIDWREGERFFLQHLADGDFANNNGGWQWSASTGTDAVPYFRVFNPAAQGAKCDPGGAYTRTWVPELHEMTAREIHAPADAARVAASYPRPIVDHAAARRRAIAAFAQARVAATNAVPRGRGRRRG